MVLVQQFYFDIDDLNNFSDSQVPKSGNVLLFVSRSFCFEAVREKEENMNCGIRQEKEIKAKSCQCDLLDVVSDFANSCNRSSKSGN